jgi:transcriptional regulator with XRE-family HTH domain
VITLRAERLHDLDTPGVRYAPAILTPFQTGSERRAKIGGGLINEGPCEHGPLIGQIVQKVKDNSPNARNEGRWHNLSMSGLMTPAEFVDLYIARVKALREMKGVTSAQMAELLGVPAERYRKYESRTPLPHELVEKFALIVGVTVEFLITGRRVAGKGPYPDVPGPHTLNEHRAEKPVAEANRADSSQSVRKRASK